MASPESWARKFLVPERAMVPRCETRSSSFMPMPVSEMVRVFFSSSSVEVDARSVDAIADEGLELVVGEGEVAELVERVGGVGDELAEEDLRVRVERMDDQLQELANFGLELLLGHISSIIAKTEGV